MRPAGILISSAAAVLLVAAVQTGAPSGAAPARSGPNLDTHFAGNCEYSTACAEVANPTEVFGSEYVGHDEPSALFYSHKRGSGNRVRYDVVLPRDPSPNHATAPGKSYNFELQPAPWFGMAVCDTQSYPEQVPTCKPDSDRNIVDPAASPNHPGTGFTELQFYPPGWVPWPTWAVAVGASGCDPTRWCAALNLFGLLEDPVNGTLQNDACAAQVGIEYWNFAFVTKNGVSQAPANPVDSTLRTFTPDLSKDLLMNAGDHLVVTEHDTRQGLRVDIYDRTTGAHGSMTAGPSNGFAQIKFDPSGTSCTALPYAFHPMYSTSSEKTRVIWAAHTYNIAFSDEIGHFDTCTGPHLVPSTEFGLDASGNPISCPAGNSELTGPTDGDDSFCFPGSRAMLYDVTGCTDSNTGFDGFGYQRLWPDGNTRLHPEPFRFSAARTGRHYNVNYTRLGFEADLPRIEETCDRTTGDGCTLIPTTDKGTPAAFYPFFSQLRSRRSHTCLFGFGDDLPGSVTDFGRNAQYGSLLSSPYLIFGGGGAAHNLINNFRQVRPNPCRSGHKRDR
jgi:hypothetical protein